MFLSVFLDRGGGSSWVKLSNLWTEMITDRLFRTFPEGITRKGKENDQGDYINATPIFLNVFFAMIKLNISS